MDGIRSLDCSWKRHASDSVTAEALTFPGLRFPSLTQKTRGWGGHLRLPSRQKVDTFSSEYNVPCSVLRTRVVELLQSFKCFLALLDRGLWGRGCCQQGTPRSPCNCGGSRCPSSSPNQPLGDLKGSVSAVTQSEYILGSSQLSTVELTQASFFHVQLRFLVTVISRCCRCLR